MANDARIIQLGSAFLDPDTLRLRHGDPEVRLDPKELAVLLELAAGAPGGGGPASGSLARVWAGTSVVDNALEQVITRLRRALGDDAKRPRVHRDAAETRVSAHGPGGPGREGAVAPAESGLPTPELSPTRDGRRQVPPGGVRPHCIGGDLEPPGRRARPRG